MIIAVNKLTKAFIVFDTDIQNDVENTILWMAGDLDADGFDVDFDFDYYFTDEVEGWTQAPRIRPNRPWESFLLSLSPSYLEFDNQIQFLIQSYNLFWKDKTPFKEFFEKL